MWLFLFLLLIPTQLGKHFWPEWSYLMGIRIDYLSPTLYLLDLVWVVLIFNWIKPSVLRTSPLTGRLSKIFKFKYFLIAVFVGINILMAVNPWVAVYKWLRVVQLLITFFYFRKNKILVKENLIKIIPCWIILESLLAMAQMAKSGSLNGIFYWLGERSFSFNTIGIAQMSVFGKGLIRAYGTFSHPNSLAGFLLVSLLLWWWLREKINKTWWWMVFWFGFLGIMVSGSRTIWILTLGLIFWFLLKNIKNKVNIVGLILLVLGVIIFGLRLVNMEYQVSDFLGGWDSDGIGKRIQLNVAGLKMIKESSLFGVGLGNFLVRLPEFQKNNGIFWLQPVHNVLILAWSEIGILGLSLMFLFFSENFSRKKINWIFKIILGIVIISGMVDHYWLTLPQNVWLLVLVLGLV
ncbi:MAG: O-antigen ligase family protein [Candidatus Shapirobacteria bacterium]|nr:O-antigen ligase family protein [Candidatus Shapirobacteria bacterium]MDD3002691.1 O-antigen ligase family protein [Candidatus Shapirobacteria bacterium]MDD4382895.1 O-antigen ligase family protein [Candidatus Shapirobacteria bacterium]